MASDHRSIIPSIPGAPWWAAVVVAVTGTAAGFAFDAGSSKELTTVFSALYVAGCLAAAFGRRLEDAGPLAALLPMGSRAASAA